MIKRYHVLPGIYKNMCVWSDHFVGGSPSTLHYVNNKDRALILKLEVETAAESTLQARYKSTGDAGLFKGKLNREKIARLSNMWGKRKIFYICGWTAIGPIIVGNFLINQLLSTLIPSAFEKLTEMVIEQLRSAPTQGRKVREVIGSTLSNRWRGMALIWKNRLTSLDVLRGITQSVGVVSPERCTKLHNQRS